MFIFSQRSFTIKPAVGSHSGTGESTSGESTSEETLSVLASCGDVRITLRFMSCAIAASNKRGSETLGKGPGCERAVGGVDAEVNCLHE